MWDLKQKGWDPISWNPAPQKTKMDTKNHHAFEECSSLNLDSGNGTLKKTNHKGAGIFIRCIPYVDQPRAPFFSGIFEWRKLLLQNGGCQMVHWSLRFWLLIMSQNTSYMKKKNAKGYVETGKPPRNYWLQKNKQRKAKNPNKQKKAPFN